ncbi:MAG: hypothetical protein KGI06_04930 [Candidatus Micrarchaeota archaeon]|nr:hypothetical protein [Candidatus Micrarchaeota archaeon]
MAKSDVEKVTEEKIAKGGVLVKLYFDMQHKEKDKLQPLLVDLINERLMKEPGVVYCYGSVEEPLEKEGTYITSAMVTMLFDKFQPLVGVAFRYAPAGIEILKPSNTMSFKIFELQAMLMDLSQISVDYSKYILEKVLKPEDIENIRTQLENRTETGKKLLEKKDEANP